MLIPSIYILLICTRQIEPIRVHFVRLLTLVREGSKLEKSRLRQTAAHGCFALFWVFILVDICKRLVSFPRRRVYVCCFGGYGRVSAHFLPPHLVCLFLSFDALLTR